MNTSIFTSPTELIGGLLAGILFGFFLQKANVTRFSTIVGQLILKDFTVMKVILTAIAAGSLGLYSLKYFFLSNELIISSTTLFAALAGGGVFGIGMAILGYCPGTCIGALAEKSRDAWFGLLGMVCGAGIYAETFSWINVNVKPANQINKMTLAQHFGISPWILIISLCLIVVLWAAIDNFTKKSKA